jgi:hypothetical protein
MGKRAINPKVRGATAPNPRLSAVQSKIDALVDDINRNGNTRAKAERLRKLKETRDKLEGLEALNPRRAPNPQTAKERALLAAGKKMALAKVAPLVAITNPSRRNHHNDQAAIDAYRDFHGREPGELIEFDRPVKYPGRTTALGDLVKLKVKVPAGRLEGSRIVTLSNFKGALLTRHPREVQLYLEGGDQSVDLEEFGILEPHGIEFLGEVTEITYYTRKDHLGREGGEANYVHTFGRNEETGEKTERPLLNYDVTNEQLIFAGGGYSIPAEGIDG